MIMRTRSSSLSLRQVIPAVGLVVVLGSLTTTNALGDAEVAQEELKKQQLGSANPGPAIAASAAASDLEDASRTPELFGSAPPDTLSAPRRRQALEAAALSPPPLALPEADAMEETSPFAGLKPFGFDVFSQGAGAFQTLDETPVPADYRLGPGDKLVINVWGRVDRTYELEIDREGKIFVPQAGTVVVWGLDLDEATERVRQQLASVYSGFKVSVMMGRVRSIRVYVYGEAVQTGGYAVSALSTLMNVLHQAGGPTGRGSLRGIRLLRGGGIYRTIDLYDVLLRGEGGEPDLHLNAQDVIFIPVVGSQVGVAGEVKRPAIYELSGGETVAGVIALAGGPAPEAYLQRVSIERVVAGNRTVLDLDLTDATQAATPVAAGDRVVVYTTDREREEVVYLEGWVKYPRAYGYRPGLRVSELLRQGEVLRTESYLPRAVIRRPLPDGTHRLIPVDLSAALGPHLLRGALPATQGLLAGEGPERLGNPETADPPAYGAPAAATADPVLEPRDILHVYSAREVGWQHHVTIDGEVKAPGRYELARNMRLTDLIFEAGGLLPGAELADAEVVRLFEDGRSATFAVNLRRLLIDCDPSADLKLEQDDAVFVRRLPDRLEPEKVLIDGEVRFPGRYSLTRRDEPLSEVLKRAGGLSEHAFPPGAVFTRASIAEDIERQNVLPVFMSFRSDSTTGIPMSTAPWLAELRPELLPSHRVAIDFTRLVENGKRRYDVALRDGDHLFVPRRPTAIPVIGLVAAAGSVQYVPGESVGFYLDRAGGITPGGDKRGIRIVRANGEVEKCGRGEGVEMGDSIVVPPRHRQGRNWRWLRAGLGTVAGAAASVVVINLLN